MQMFSSLVAPTATSVRSVRLFLNLVRWWTIYTMSATSRAVKFHTPTPIERDEIGFEWSVALNGDFNRRQKYGPCKIYRRKSRCFGRWHVVLWPRVRGGRRYVDAPI